MNIYTTNRFQGLLSSLNSTYLATAESSSASKGAGRANFINNFLEQTIPPAWRISTNGEVTDQYGEKTGELDIVIENGFFPSLPVIGSSSTRLFLQKELLQ